MKLIKFMAGFLMLILASSFAMALQWNNGDINQWGSSPLIPLGWTIDGWSHEANWRNLVQETTIKKTGSYSAGFISKGYSGTLSPTSPCDDWCMWQTSTIPVIPRQFLKVTYSYYPVLFQRISGTDGVRVDIVWYDSSMARIGASGIGTLSQAQFNNLNTWHDVTGEKVIPDGAAYAALKFTIATRTDNQFITTFYIDDIQYETRSCTENWQCSGWSYCQAGYQTRDCVDTNQCGTRFSYPNSQQQCFVSIQSYISDFAQQKENMPALITQIDDFRRFTISNKEFEDMWWKIRFTERGNDYDQSWHRSEAYMGWGDAGAIDSMLTMYEATDDTKYLDEAIKFIDWELDLWVWQAGSWQVSGDTQQCNPSHDRPQSGNLATNYVRFANIVKTHNLAQYYAKAEEYYQFTKTNMINCWDESFKPMTLAGSEVGCVVDGDPNGAFYCDRFNALAQVATTYLYADLYHPDPSDRDKADRMARFFKVTGLHIKPNPVSFGDHYTWGYRVYTGLPTDNLNSGGIAWGQYENGIEEEYHYASYDIRLVSDFWKNGRIFTDSDMQLFANTMTKNSWNGDASDPRLQRTISAWRNVTDGSFHQSYETGEMQGFSSFAEVDPTLRLISERIAKRLYDDGLSTGTFWSNYYQCIYTVNFGKVCYGSSQTEPDMQLMNIANILYARKQVGES